MNIQPKDISVLIPSYGRIELTKKAVLSALNSGAGEVILSEDKSSENMKSFNQISDSRFKFIENQKNLGLWKNHYALIKYANKQWIKFLQTDDYLHSNCLKIMCSFINNNTSLISALPIYANLENGSLEKRYILKKAIRYDGGKYVNRMAKVGNEPGRPSYILYKRESLIIKEDAWKNDMSCDLVANVISASRGEVVLLPPGLVFCGIHKERDGAKQSFELYANRLKNSIIYLSRINNHNIKKFVSIYGAVEIFALLRVFIAKRKKLDTNQFVHLIMVITQILKIIRWGELTKNYNEVKFYYKYKYQKSTPIRIPTKV